MDIAYPWQITPLGRTAAVDEARHVRDLIEQVLFTSPGERVNRPSFGTGVKQLVFAPSSPELATAIEFMVQGALQQWLGERAVVEKVDVLALDATLQITISYVVRRTQQRETATFVREV